MIGRATLTPLRCCAPQPLTCCRPHPATFCATVRTFGFVPGEPVVAASSSNNSNSSSCNDRSCDDSDSRRSRLDDDRIWGPRTTYEGSADFDMGQKQAPFCGFSRGNFVSQIKEMKEMKDKYQVGKELASGATAKVYQAVNLRTNQTVALKAICKSIMPDDNMLRNEIQIHKEADHPNILRLLETFEDDKYLYLVTELCEGGDLRGHLEDLKNDYSVLQMSEKDALQLFQQVVASVRYLHKQGIVHRDLKPGNFLVAGRTESSSSQRMVLKLTDFGVSTSCPLKHLLTRRVGTDGFMAPEVLRCSPYNEKADIFSIGCILHNLLTGNPPKRSDDGVYKIDMLRLRFVSDEMRNLVKYLTQALPEDRPSIEEVVLEPLLQSSENQLRSVADSLHSQMLDQMYAFSTFPLMKKAAVVAMVSRAESDSDFLPYIEKFMSFGSYASMNCAISADDLHSALVEELVVDMQQTLKRTLDSGRCQPSGRVARRRRRSKTLWGPATQRFQHEIKAELERLVRNIDSDMSGAIGYSEWLAATVDSRWYSDPQRIDAVFKLFDWDQDGMISEDDLKKVIPSVFTGVSVDCVLQESQLDAAQKSWIDLEHFRLLMRTQNHSFFTLRRIANGEEGPLNVSDASSLHDPKNPLA